MSWKIKNKLKQVVRNEKGTIVKEWGGKSSTVIIYPNTYFVGMSNLGIHNIYRIVNSANDAVCERAFFPEREDILEYKRTSTPILSLESMRAITDFDVIAFSVAFENDIPNIKTILDLAKIPLKKEDRLDGGYPKLIIGGAVVILNPGIFKSVFDEVITSDAEDFFDLGKRKSPSRSVIWTNNTEFGSMHLVEMQRGCPNRCKFCAAPIIYNPFRQFSKELIIEVVDEGLAHKKKVGLIGGDILSHPNFEEIVEYIHSKGATFSPSSVRADRITENIAKLLNQSGHKTITLAPEAGSESLRLKIGKNIPDDKFFKAAEILVRHGIKQFKLYFMIGLPSETEEDLSAVKKFIGRFKLSGAQKISVSVNPFVPKLKTPFEKETFADPDKLKGKENRLKAHLKGIGGLSLRFESPLSALREYKFQLTSLF